VNVTVMSQPAPTARLDPQVFVCWKSEALGPEKVKPFIAIGAEPPFVTVTFWAVAVVPTLVVGNVSDAGDIVIAESPVPERGTVCGLPAASWVIVIDAMRSPTPAGAKVTVMVQLALLSTLVPHVFVCVKSPELAPVTEIEVMFNEVVAELVSVTVCDSLGLR
jgi:hypothetical protein